MTSSEKDADQRWIWLYYLRSLEVFEVAFATLRRSEGGISLSGNSQFAKLSPRQMDQAFRELRAELELEVCLALLASFEVILRHDFAARVASQLTGPSQLTAACRALDRRVQEAGRRAPALEDVLGAWKVAFPGMATTVGAFIVVAVNFRNWLAHGRAWSPRGHAGYDTTHVIKAAQALEQAIPDFPRLTDW